MKGCNPHTVYFHFEAYNMVYNLNKCFIGIFFVPSQKIILLSLFDGQEALARRDIQEDSI